MEQLIGTYLVTYTQAGGGTLHIENLVMGFTALELAGEPLAELRELLRMQVKSIRRFAERYNVITGAAGDLSVYDVASGKRMVYMNSDEVRVLRAVMEGEV